MRVVAFEACVGRELAAVGENVFARIDLREVSRARIEATVAKLAQLTAAADRHLGHHLSFFEIGVKRHWAVAQLALHRSMNPGGVVGVLDVVTHRARVVATVANLFVAVLGNSRAPVGPELAPGLRDEKRPSEDHGDERGKEQDGGPENVLGVNERTLRIHAAGPP